MAVDRNRLAQALAYEEERRRMMESVPTPGPVQAAPPSRNLRRDLENLSIGIGEGLTNQLKGIKGIVTDPLGAVKGAYETVKGVVRDPSVIADALRYTAQKAGSGPLGAGEVIGEMVSPMRGRAPVMAEIDVYHGSPHRFDEFDASKIGTGEGAQAYGHGIYLAENPEIARDYQVRLSYDPEKMKIGGKQINAVYNQLQDAAARMPPARAAAEYEKLDLIERLMMNNPVDEVEKAAAELSPATQKWFATQVKPSFETYGSFYKADLPDEMVDRMLDWDKTLSEQSPSVLAALEKSKNKQIRAMLEYAKTPYTGAGIEGETKTMGEAYRTMSMSLSGRANAESAKASKLLQQAGIPGVRYLDAGSRGQGGSGTRNFVVFPGEEKKVKILKRE